MRVLWITNIPIAHHKTMLNIGTAQSGGWMEASYEALKGYDKLQLGIATVYPGGSMMTSNDGAHFFYLLPWKGKKTTYNANSSYNQNLWRKVIEEFKPSIIHVWGTENAFGLCALKVAKKIPSVIYVQGVIHEIYKHYLDGLQFDTLNKHTSFHDCLRNKGAWFNERYYQKAMADEKEMLQLSKNVIVESEWAAAHCSCLAEGCKIHFSLLPVNPLFASVSWSWGDMNPHTIFTVAGGYPIKGHHVLFKAFSYVLKKYPDAMLRIPGDYSMLQQPWYRITSYGKYLNALIKDLHIEDNIVFLGKLSPEDMAKELEKANVHVMPSNIENQSSSLIEAMMVGVPTVSAFVGGIPYYYRDGENGLFYRQNDEEVLSSKIINIFEDRALSERLSAKAQSESRLARLSINLVSDFVTIYKKVLDENNKGFF